MTGAPATAARRGGLVPTNTVTTKDGITVRARIDPTLLVQDVIKQLCLNLKIPENPILFALRDENDELLTDDNLRKKIRDKVPLKLVNAPIIDAHDIVDKLAMRDDRTLRFSLFTLQKYIKEDQFATEFLARDGLRELVEVINIAHGNTLAYALTAMQNLMESDTGWAGLDTVFISKVVHILSTPTNLINVCRPATAILKKLVEADPRSMPGPALGSSSRSPQTPQHHPAPGSVYRYGFDVVYEQMKKERTLLEIVVHRLDSPDATTGLYSMLFINSLLSHATETYWEEFTAELERLNVTKAVIRLMSSLTVDDLTSSILDFQANMVRVTYHKKTKPVEPDLDRNQSVVLDWIWRVAKLDKDDESEMIDEEEDDTTNGEHSGANGRRVNGYAKRYQWKKLGFQSDDLREEFAGTGVLGLECLRAFVQSDPDRFAQLILEQNSRPSERRCPIARASNEVVEILSEHWSIFAPGYSTSTAFQPFFLSFHKVHMMALLFFLRMWSESGATATDFSRVASLVSSQVKVALRKESERPWHELEKDFVESEYRSVRDRQMKELELEDDLLNKVPVRNLRAKLYKESYEFVRQQRIQCLIQGAWFVNGIPLANPGGTTTGSAMAQASRKTSRPWRYMRLDRNLRNIHFVDSAVKFPVRSGLEDLPDKIDVNLIGEIAINTCALPPSVSLPAPADHVHVPPTLTPTVASPLSFSLLSVRGGGESLGDQVATDASRWADWTDGLNMLRRDGGHVATQETAGFVHALTEIGLKIKLLDLSGEKVDIPSVLNTGAPPANTDFFFSDL